MAKNKPTFYTYERVEPMSEEYHYVERPNASRVEVVEGIETFAYKHDSGNWKVYEATTGMYIDSSRWCTTRKAAVEDAKKTIESFGIEECKSVIEQRISKFGKSPYNGTAAQS